jgi:hypothetical protein
MALVAYLAVQLEDDRLQPRSWSTPGFGQDPRPGVSALRRSSLPCASAGAFLRHHRANDGDGSCSGVGVELAEKKDSRQYLRLRFHSRSCCAVRRARSHRRLLRPCPGLLDEGVPRVAIAGMAGAGSGQLDDDRPDSRSSSMLPQRKMNLDSTRSSASTAMAGVSYRTKPRSLSGRC